MRHSLSLQEGGAVVTGHIIHALTRYMCPVFSSWTFLTACHNRIKNIKSSMARRIPVENLLRQNVGSIINCLQ